jgi:hypothetical protein
VHDTLRSRLLSRIESLPEAQLYQVLDYIEFLESKYATDLRAETSGLQKFAERLEDRLRLRTVSPATLREAFQLIASADRVLSNVSNAGKQLFSDLNGAIEGPDEAQEGRGEEGALPASGSEGGEIPSPD